MQKTIIITGANGNLGTVVVSKFLEKDYRVIATVIEDSMRDSLGKHDDLDVRVVNLSDEGIAAHFIAETLSRYDKIDAALMLAGGFSMGNTEKTSTEDVRKMVALNFETAYNVARPLFTHMLSNNSGRLVFVGARPALDPAAGKNMIAYGLSKSLLFKLAEYLNADAKGKNVTATVIVPSTIDTPPNRKSMPDANVDNWVKPEQIANLLEMIVSETGAPLRETVLKIYNNA
jgi:NAD(P)-dependent dehydrogenase (short-subunit alcohol dehydrogenase family)